MTKKLINNVQNPRWHVTSKKTGRGGRGVVPVEVVLSFDGGEDVGKSERCDILPDELEGSLDFR